MRTSLEVFRILATRWSWLHWLQNGEDLPWVHLDIAGTAYLDDAKPFAAKGPTGVAVRTLVGLAQHLR